MNDYAQPEIENRIGPPMTRLGCILTLACFLSAVLGLVVGLIVGAAEMLRRTL